MIQAAQACIDAGAPGITVHPRADGRHITTTDVHELAALLAPLRERVELNIEGDPREDLISLVEQIRPHQFTLVPVLAGELTSNHGWRPNAAVNLLRVAITRAHAVGTRVSMFVDPDTAAIDWAAAVGADRIELYTEPYARAFARGSAAGTASFTTYCEAALHAKRRNLGINAGHDLDLENLRLFRTLPHLEEVSIGHALMARALFHGLDRVVRQFLAALAPPVDATMPAS